MAHSGILAAAIQAVEAVNHCLARVKAAIDEVGGVLLITADHGNIEQMIDPVTGQQHTAHTTNVVPLLYIGRQAHLAETGALEDLAPNLLKMMGLPQPHEMTGHPLIELDTA